MVNKIRYLVLRFNGRIRTPLEPAGPMVSHPARPAF